MGRERLIAVLLGMVMIALGVRILVRDDTMAVVGSLQGPAFGVYFASSADVKLEPEIHFGQPTLEELLTLLAAGPQTPGLLQVLPEGTKILGARQMGAVVHVNFSRELLSAHQGALESWLLCMAL